MSMELENRTDYSYLFKNSFVEEGINSSELVEKTMSFNLPFAEVKAHNLWFNGIRICNMITLWETINTTYLISHLAKERSETTTCGLST